MPNPQKCQNCHEEFQDGDVIGLSLEENQNYHVLLPPHDNPATTCDCAISAGITTEKPTLLYNRGIFHQGKIYGLDSLTRLQQTQHLQEQVLDNTRGLRIIGNLEDLTRETPIGSFDASGEYVEAAR